MLPRERAVIFWLQMIYLGALTALAVLYFTGDIHPRESIGTVPIAIPWFGALGGVLISLKGVYDHAYDWDPSFRLWHISRPFVASALGVIAVLIVQSGIVAVGTDPEPEGTVDRPTNLFYYLVAFLVGYREETFRELIKRLVDVILMPGGPAAVPPVITAIQPNQGPSGQLVEITGSGLTGVTSIKFGSANATYTPHTDGLVVAAAPDANAGGQVSVTLVTPGGAATTSFTYTGVAPVEPAPEDPA